MKLHKLSLVVLASTVVVSAADPKKQNAGPSPLNQYVRAAEQSGGPVFAAAPGAIWSPGSQFADLARDLRASQVNDIVTIVVTENASATVSGATKTSRKSSVNSSITALAGVTKATGPWANLANVSGDRELDGSGTTSRQTTITTTVTARVSQVLPNGYLVLEGSKDVQINSERQTVTLRGVIRPVDLAPDDSVASNRLAQMEIHVNGKGVVNDAIKRPFFLYRLLMGLLPF
jgi:flagellar L-ring protein precursor FlgH